MVVTSGHTDVRFAWGYFVASLLPIGLIGSIYALPAMLGLKQAYLLGLES